MTLSSILWLGLPKTRDVRLATGELELESVNRSESWGGITNNCFRKRRDVWHGIGESENSGVMNFVLVLIVGVNDDLCRLRGGEMSLSVLFLFCWRV